MLQVFSAYFFRTMREGFAGKFRSAAAQALCSGVMKLECGGPGRNWRIGKRNWQVDTGGGCAILRSWASEDLDAPGRVIPSGVKDHLTVLFQSQQTFSRNCGLCDL